MKVIILAGGLGTRLSEETDVVPKPMVEIGGKPILWHIMKIYSHYGFNEFVILLGYKGYLIKEYFANYFLHTNDVTIELVTNKIKVHQNTAEPWKVTLVDTGVTTMTGGRVKLAQSYLNNKTFLLTYGDGVSDINIRELIKFHKKHGKLITMTSVQPEGRFGALRISTRNKVTSFKEKPIGDGSWINGGFFVCEPGVIDYIEGNDSVFEKDPLERLAKDGELYAYQHSGFWQCMDTLRDKRLLNELWSSGNSRWKVWN
jgi:glucose-1-phosphate cytidylyltransferase